MKFETTYAQYFDQSLKIALGRIFQFNPESFTAFVRINNNAENIQVRCQLVTPLLDPNGYGINVRPKEGDFCLVAFDSNNHGYIIGYTTLADRDGGTGYRHKQPKMLGGDIRFSSDNGTSNIYIRKGGLIQLQSGDRTSMLLDPNSSIIRMNFVNYEEGHPGPAS